MYPMFVLLQKKRQTTSTLPHLQKLKVGRNTNKTKHVDVCVRVFGNVDSTIIIKTFRI
eukprot:NODE_2327_length_437_cov_40.015464_g2246_i0.p2 GENE.NODE_2327_length_437_cov_40.015464_g2246_i0~~NODE_2327_length_437_cov_40.015464_g2246_i0.p2  ORF type:complete len:58 (-),score=5.33 NODE_2327_length_437_cov_40.015464_g2246_i0:59-232(-)